MSASRWSGLIPLSIVPAAAANLPNGKVLLWSSEDRYYFLTPGVTGRTYTTVLDPATGVATERLVVETGHDMFCPGTTNLPDGRVLVSGGIDAGKTSLYDATTDRWTAGGDMKITRGYQSNVLLRDGAVFTIGGSWSGGQNGGKDGEIWTEAGGWRRLPGVPALPMQTDDAAGVFRSDNHMWLFNSPGGRLLQAGPSRQMHWIDTDGNGAVAAAGLRNDDPDAMNATVVSYEPGKILKAGGSPSYSSSYAQAGAYLIDISDGLAVSKLPPMNYSRVFHSSVVLPNGQVVVAGGQTYASPLSDDNSVLVPELWDPTTRSFTLLPRMNQPRNYHSAALLLPDARVLAAGGGLCGPACPGNHPDAEILTPYYLLNADGTAAARPTLVSAPGQAEYGTEIDVETSWAVQSLVLVRLASATHTVNHDQLRVPLVFRSTGTNRYRATMPSNPNLALPGFYMLFAIDARGVPSVARTMRLGSDDTPRLPATPDRKTARRTAVDVDLAGQVGSGVLRHAATGLPPGLAISEAGRVTGVPTRDGRYRVQLRGESSVGVVSSEFAWTIGR